MEAHVVIAARGMNLRLFAWLIALGAAALTLAIWIVPID